MAAWVQFERRKENTQLIKLLGLKPVSMTIRRGGLRWFGRVECKNDADWIKLCRLTELDRVEEDLVGLCQSGYRRCSG